jgi:hypothetical protein
MPDPNSLVFPGRGGTPLQPQQFYVQDYALPTATFVFRGWQRSLPEAWWFPPANAFQSWTWSYNRNLTGQDILPVGYGDEWYELPPPPQPEPGRTWIWSYNKNLIGKDKLPPGDQWFGPTPWGLIWQFGYGQTWILNLLETTLQPKLGPLMGPFNQFDWPNARAPAAIDQTWTWSYNQNLIGQDILPAGEQFYVLAPGQIPSEQTQLHSWQWSYNLNLIGRDKLPSGKQSYELAADQRPPWPNFLRAWEWKYNLNLIGKDVLPSGVQLYELAPAQKAPEQTQLHTWQWLYNLNLIGQDKLPAGVQSWERPTLPIPPPALTWIDAYKYTLFAKPFAQTDWPNPTQPYRIDQTWTWQYNLNLIGQDQRVAGAQLSDLPPRDFPRLLQTWIQQTNLALLTQPQFLPFLARNQDWPTPRGAEPDWRRSWTWSYNLDLLGQDQLPFRQQDWPLTPALGRSADLLTAINTTRFAIVLPFNQTDWPLPRGPQPLLQTWINTIALPLIAVPFNQTYWPNPTPPFRDPTLASWAASYNPNLIGQDRLPNRQQDWPLSPAYAPTLLQTWIEQTNTALLATTVSPYAPLPYLARNQDWPLPGAPIYPNDLRAWPTQGSPAPVIPGIPAPPTIGPAVYNKTFLAGPGYLDVIPGNKPS